MRPICFDVTHMVSRLGLAAPTGIDSVDLRYGRFFGSAQLGPGVHYAKRTPNVISSTRISEIARLASDTPWEGKSRGDDIAYATVNARLSNAPEPPQSKAPAPWDRRRASIALSTRQWLWRHMHSGQEVPKGAIYLNVAQHMLEHPHYFEWLDNRHDVETVFMIHDLLPLDFPEFFLAEEVELFARRIATAAKNGRAFITTTLAVKERLEQELRARSNIGSPIHLEPLPSMLEASPDDPPAGTSVAGKAMNPYFVVLGTIEARKNHLLLLHVWRRLLLDNKDAPTLVIIGARGWSNAQTLDMLDRCKLLRGHVIEASGLSSHGVRQILRNARALLMPSFEEGYGLPLVEALSLGVPVVTNTSRVFREVTQGRAIYLDPLDGLAWRDTVLRLASTDGACYQEASAAALQFVPPRWHSYFNNVLSFLRSL